MAECARNAPKIFRIATAFERSTYLAYSVLFIRFIHSFYSSRNLVFEEAFLAIEWPEIIQTPNKFTYTTSNGQNMQCYSITLVLLCIAPADGPI